MSGESTSLHVQVYLKTEVKLNLKFLSPFLPFRVLKYLIKERAHWPIKYETPRRGCKLEMKGRINVLSGDFKIRFMPFRGC